MRNIILVATCLACLLFSGTLVRAQNTKTITTAVPLLLIAPDSRGGAMGDAGVAVASGANSMHWNASALGFSDSRMGFAMSYSPWLRALGIPDINLMYLSGYYNTGGTGTVGASLRYFSLGEIQFTDPNGLPTGTDNPNEFALDVGYALRLTPVLSGAISLRYINSRLGSTGNISPDGRAVNTVAGDVSFLYRKDFTLRGAAADMPIQFSSGINISNIGPKVSYTQSTVDRDFIPINLRVGYAFKFFLDDYNSITFTNDFNKLMVPSEGGRSDVPLLTGMFGSFGDAPGGFGEEISEINTSLGLEYWYRDLFAARAGFFYEDPLKGNRRFMTVGAGIKYNVFGVDFAYLVPLTTNHPLENTLRFTLTYDFESAGNE